MKTRWLLVALLLGWVSGSWAQGELKPSEAKTRETLLGVVQKQLEAFRAGDYRAAYVYADEALKAQVPVEAFEAMVRGHYPNIANSVSASFGLSFDNGQVAVVLVRVMGSTQESDAYHYVLRRTGDVWQVAAVFKVKPHIIEV